MTLRFPCPGCRRPIHTYRMTDYHCPDCGAFWISLYRREHLDPERARALTEDEARREYRVAGLPFRHCPNWPRVAGSVLGWRAKRRENREVA